MARKDPFFLGGVSSRYFLFSKLQSSFLFLSLLISTFILANLKR